jgi:hypothetical protein
MAARQAARGILARQEGSSYAMRSAAKKLTLFNALQ